MSSLLRVGQLAFASFVALMVGAQPIVVIAVDNWAPRNRVPRTFWLEVLAPLATTEFDPVSYLRLSCHFTEQGWTLQDSHGKTFQLTELDSTDRLALIRRVAG